MAVITDPHVVANKTEVGDTVLPPGGVLFVQTKGTIIDTLNSGGIDVVGGIGVTSAFGINTTLSANGAFQGRELVSAGGTTTGTDVGFNSFQVVFNGGVASTTTVTGFNKSVAGTANEFVQGGGVTVATTVNNFGVEFVSAGGLASNTIVTSGGVLILSGGGA